MVVYMAASLKPGIFSGVILICLFGACLTNPAFAERDLPRFVSIGADKAYARSGPSRQYPVLWVYQRRGLTVEIVNEYEYWRKVRDIDGQGGWMHQSLLTAKRTAIINAAGTVFLKNSPADDAQIIAGLEPRVVVDLLKCQKNWCRVKKADFYGWVERNFLWGIYPGEQIN